VSITLHPRTPQAYKFLHDGTLALTEVTAAGLHVDVEYCQRKRKHLDRQTKKLHSRLASTDLVKQWKKKYGRRMNWDSNEQMADIVYNVLGYKAKTFTEKGNPSTSQGALEALRLPAVEHIVGLSRLKEAAKVLDRIMRETVLYPDGSWRLHPFFHLSRVGTFRSSSSDPNAQNFPKRVEYIMRIVRRAIMARPGHQLGEVDFSGAEIRTAYCYHKDPGMYDELTNSKRDMHRDMAMECYKLSTADMGEKGSPIYKMLRHCGKNKYVFPEFYGSYFAQVAQDLWDEIDLLQLKTAKGVPMRRHLTKKGIRSYNDFLDHLEEVEHRFWYDRFPVYAEWKRRQIIKYERRGYVDLKTGFRCLGHMRHNQVINFPVQGTSFHMLLWSLIRLNQIMHEENWRTKIVGQIHDSILFDFHPDETQYVLQTAQRVMTKELPEAWPWIIVPLEVDADVAPVDSSWNTAEKYIIQ